MLAICNSQSEAFLYLIAELRCNVESLDAKKNNLLHIAVQVQNIDIIIKLVLLDSDHCVLRSHKNQFNKTPLESCENKFEDFLITIWDRVKQGNNHKIREYVQANNSYGGKLYHINSQTHFLRNTPLHIAVSSHSASTIKVVLSLGADPLIKNSKGLSSIDYAIKLKCSPYIMTLLKQSLIS